jgi:hypothetical protein
VGGGGIYQKKAERQDLLSEIDAFKFDEKKNQSTKKFVALRNVAPSAVSGTFQVHSLEKSPNCRS